MIKRALFVVALAALGACGRASPDAASHDADATCGADGQVHVTGSSWNDGHYSVNGGSQVTFGVSFTLTLPGNVVQTIVVGSATEPTQTLHAGPCTPPPTTTSTSAVTTTTVAPTTTTCADCVPNTNAATTTTGVTTTTAVATTTTTVPETTTTGATTTTAPDTTTTTPAVTTTVPGATTTLPPTFQFAGATTICIVEVPTIRITFGNALPQLAGRVGVLTMSTLSGTVLSTQELVYAPGTTIDLLYPGTTVNPDGTIADVPGWNLNSAGFWVPDPSDAALRDGIVLTYTVNPTATAVVTYPPESSACANPDGPFPPTPTPPVGLPHTR